MQTEQVQQTERKSRPLPLQWEQAAKGDQDAWTAALVMAGQWGERLMLSAVDVITGAMPLDPQRSCFRCAGCGVSDVEAPFCERWEDDPYADITFAANPERAPQVIALWCDGFCLKGE